MQGSQKAHSSDRAIPRSGLRMGWFEPSQISFGFNIIFVSLMAYVFHGWFKSIIECSKLSGASPTRDQMTWRILPLTKTVEWPIPVTFEIPFQRRQNGCAKPIVIAAEHAPQQDPDLIALVADTRRLASELLEGRASSIQHITEREGLRSGSVSRILPLVWLAPDISTAILEGRQPPHLTAKTLPALPELPMDWSEQQRILGFAQSWGRFEQLKTTR